MPTESLDPAEAWPFPHAQDYELDKYRLISVADVFAGESKRIRKLQALALGFGVIVVVTLLCFLGVAIRQGFGQHLESTEQILKEFSKTAATGQALVISEKSANTLSAASAADAVQSSDKNKTRDRGYPVAPAAVSASMTESTLHELFATGVKVIASSTVAVIWVLVLAIAVITIAIARAVLSLKPQGLDKSGSADVRSELGVGDALPGLTFAKEVIHLVSDAVKSLPK